MRMMMVACKARLPVKRGGESQHVEDVRTCHSGVNMP